LTDANAAHNRSMAEGPDALNPPGPDPMSEPGNTESLPLQTGADEIPSRPRWSWQQRLQDRQAAFEQGAAGRYSPHLPPADFMNSSFGFAALAVLSAFPFLAVTSTVIGGDIRQAIVARMGLNAQAKHDIDGLIATGNQAVATLTWFSAVVVVLGGIGMASTLS